MTRRLYALTDSTGQIAPPVLLGDTPPAPKTGYAVREIVDPSFAGFVEGRTAFVRSDGTVELRDLRTLAQAKAERISLLRDAREARIRDTFTWGGSTFDADMVSQLRLMGARVAVLDGTYTATPWRLADNTWRSLSSTDVVGVWAAMQSHLREPFLTFQSLETSVSAAANKEAVDAVSWPS